MDEQEKIDMVMTWADEKDRGFDTEFVESLQESLDNYGSLTVAQENALDNIIEQWHIS